MRNNFKKFAAIALALVMCVSALVPVFAVDVCPGEGKVHTATNCTWTEAGKKEATCGVAGTVSGKCDTCSAVFTVSTTAALAHNYEVVSGDCTTSTTKTCSVCGDTKVVSAAEGHDWSEWTVAGGKCEKGAAISRVCSVCKYEEKTVMLDDHNFELVSVKEPVNCLDKGAATYECASKDCAEKKVVEIWAANSQYHAWTDVDSTKNIEATCFRSGKQAQECTVCEATQIIDTKQKEHNFVVPTDYAATVGVYKLPTCTENGLKDYKECTMCHQYQYNTTAWTFSKTEDAGKGAYAKTGDDYIGITANKADLVIPAQHDWNKDTLNSTDATCTTVGQEILYCQGADCAFNTTAKKDLVPATGHKYYDELPAEEKKADDTDTIKKWAWKQLKPTCEKEAYGEYTCLNDGCDVTKKVVTEPKLDACVPADDYDAALSTANTCTTAGQLVYRCKHCNDIIVSATVNVPAIGHKIDKAVPAADNAPTCKEDGLGYYTCSNVEKQVKDCLGNVVTCDYTPETAEHQLVVLPKVDHNWKEVEEDGTLTTITPLKCNYTERDKTYVRKCEWCAKTETYTEVRPAHDFYEFNKDTFNDGTKIKTYITGDCEKAYVYAPLCKECGVPGTQVVDNVNFGQGHVKKVTKEAVAATCSKAGKTDEWECTAEIFGVKCTAKETQTATPTLHQNKQGNKYSWTDVQALLAKNGLKIKDNNVDPQKITVVRIDDKSENPELVKELKVNDTLTWVFYVPVTCTEYGVLGGYKCSVCNNKDFKGEEDGAELVYTVKEETVPAHKLQYGEQVTKTCDTYGYTKATCTVCDLDFQTSYVEGGHEFPVDSNGVSIIENVIAPTCELDGSYTQTCEDCGLVVTTVVEAAGHKNEFGDEIIDSCLDRTVDRICYRCKLEIGKTHNFSDWAVNGEVETRQCVDCALAEERAIEAPETEAPVTDAPVTEAPVTEAPVTEAPETDAPVDEPAKKGCGSSIAAIGVALVATLGTCAVFCGKKED